MHGVNPQNGPLRPADLRALAARYDVSMSEISARRGVTPEAVIQALRADLTGRPVSQALLSSIRETIESILQDREHAQ